MKLHLIILTLITIAITAATRLPYDLSIDDKSQILALIERESQAFWDKDFESYADCWAHEPYVRTMGWWADGGVTVVEGWRERGSRTKSHMDAHPDPNPQNPVRKNMNIRIADDMAWVTFDQYGRDTDDPTFDMPGLSRETRILEKINGKWKIVYVGWLLEGEPAAQNSIKGTWALVHGRYGDTERKGEPFQYKIFDEDHFIFSMQLQDGTWNRNGGGTYTIDGNMYQETFVHSNIAEHVGLTAEFTFQSIGDTLIMEGPTKIIDREGSINPNEFSALINSMYEVRVRVR